MADGISFEWDGLDELIAHVEAEPARIASATGDFLLQEGTQIYDESQQLVPFEHGDLKDDGHPPILIADADQVTMQVGYGGPYAKAQEFREDYHHPGLQSTNPEGGTGKQAHFLEEPAQERFEGFVDRLADHLRGA